MSKQTDDAQTLTRYLLGSLPAAEAERLDELSVTDDVLAEALQSVENDLIDAYVQDELDEATRAQFKTHYLASANRRERVAFAQAFQLQAEKSLTFQATGEAQAEAAKVVPERKWRGLFSARRGLGVWRPAWAWGAAFAVLALLFVAGWMIFDNVRLRKQLAQTEARREATKQQAQEQQREQESQKESASPSGSSEQLSDEGAKHERQAQEQTQRDQQRVAEQQHSADGQRITDRQRIAEQQRATGQKSSSSSARAGSIASFVLSPQMRGAGQMPAVSVPPDAEHVVMRLRLEPNEFPTYRVNLLDESGSQTLWRSSSRLKARADAGGKILDLNLDARLLKPQTIYLLRVSSDAGEIVGDYHFRVVK